MRKSALVCLLGLAISTSTAPAFAQAATASATMSTSTTTIGDLLDNPQSKAVIVKYLPEVASNEQIEMARGMTLKDIQSYAADQVTDAKLAQIDAELAKLPPKK